MKYYAIGKRNQPIRMCIHTDNVAHAQLQCGLGEVYVEIAAPIDGKINSAGTNVVAAGLNLEVEMSKIREMRTALLAQCDWTMFPDSPLDQDQKEAWMAYRQQLRDITTSQCITDFQSVVWPDSPNQNAQ